MSARPLDGAAIRALVSEVADRLAPEGRQHVLILVGGSLLAWHDLRDSTQDVDSLQGSTTSSGLLWPASRSTTTSSLTG